MSILNIIKNKNINCIYFKLNPIETEGKPGKLIDIDLYNISKSLNIQFKLSKCFYINDLNSNLSRGKHSNNNASEILICLNGSFEIKLNNRIYEETFLINKNEGIFIDSDIWIDFYNFNDCIIIAFVDINYDKYSIKDSCNDFNKYIKNII
jgi:hypothetical protein